MKNNQSPITKGWFYDFRQLLKLFDDETIEKFLNANQQIYAEIAKKWSDELYSEWLCRLFHSSKMIVSATLTINTLTFAEEKNLKFTSGYLEFQALQFCMRSVSLMSPLSKWDEGSLLTGSHNSVLKTVCEIISVLDGELATKFKKYYHYLDAYNKLVSCSTPEGKTFTKEKPSEFDVTSFCELLCEVAQALSELLENAIQDKVTGDYEFLEHYIDQASRIEINGHSFLNEYDWFWIGRIKRKEIPFSNIMLFLHEGYVEDFFGTWLPEENEYQENNDCFTPDKSWNIIFDVP